VTPAVRLRRQLDGVVPQERTTRSQRHSTALRAWVDHEICSIPTPTIAHSASQRVVQARCSSQRVDASGLARGSRAWGCGVGSVKSWDVAVGICERCVRTLTYTCTPVTSAHHPHKRRWVVQNSNLE